MPIVVDPKLAEKLRQEYLKGLLEKKGNSEVINEVLGKDADPEHKMQVAVWLRQKAIEANNNPESDDRIQREVGEYLARLKQTKDANKEAWERLKDVENFKNSVLNAELKPGKLTSLEEGKVTSDALRRVASQQGAAIAVGTAPQGGNSEFVDPFSAEFEFEVNSSVAHEIAQIAKANQGYVFTAPPSQKNRNAVMDSVPILKRESRLAEAEFRKALEGKELSKVQKEAIEKACPVDSGKWQNRMEWAAYNAYNGGLKKLLPGIFGKEAATDPRYLKYLEQRDEMISMHRNYLSTNELRRYLTGLKSQRDAFAAGNEGAKFDIADLDKLIAETEEKVVAANEADAKKFAETLEKLNNDALSKVGELTDEEESMMKFRMLQLVLMASPLGFLNILGPLMEIVGPIFDGNLAFGEGLAQAMENIPFFGDIASALRLTDLFELFFDQAPIVSDLTGFLNEITDSGIMQEFGGATSPLFGSPLLLLGAAGAFSIYRLDSEVAHIQKSSQVVKDNRKNLKDAFTAFRKGLSDGKMEETIKDFLTKQLEITLKVFPKVELVQFIADAYKDGNNLEIFDGLKIKHKKEDGTEVELTLKELKAAGVDFGSPSKVVDLLKNGADGAKIDKFINHMFAYKAARGENGAEKLAKFKTFDDAAIAINAKPEREKFEKENAVAHLEERFGLEARGKDLDEKLQYCKKQAVQYEMESWRSKKHIVMGKPSPNPAEPEGTNVRDLGRDQGAPVLS